jgi:hypothetical protein
MRKKDNPDARSGFEKNGLVLQLNELEMRLQKLEVGRA